MEGRYAKIWEQIRRSKRWPTDRKYTEIEAWLDMIFTANISDKMFKGVLVKRGSFVMSNRKLAKRWKWSIGTITRHFSELELEQQVERHPHKDFTVLEIINYDLYNPIGTPDGTPNGTESGTRTESTKYIYTNKKKKPSPSDEKKIAKIISITPEVKQVLAIWSELHPDFFIALSDAQVARDIVQAKGLDPTLKAIKAAVKVEGKAFAPQILTLEDLELKWDKLKNYFLREIDRNNEGQRRDDGDDPNKDIGVIKNALGKVIKRM